MGIVTINIYKGKDMSGTPIPLAAGKKWITAKGYSYVCFANTSQTDEAVFAILPKQ